MNIQITTEQKAAISEKMAQCVRYLKEEVQAHCTKTDSLEKEINDNLTLIVTSKDLLIKETRVLELGLSFSFGRTYSLEKAAKSGVNTKPYVCDAKPEIAIEFFKAWDKVKTALMTEVSAKKEKVDSINDTINSFEV